MTVATQLVVDKDDKAFENPTKPIGPFYTEEEAKQLMQEKGYAMKEDAGRGWRRVVASPTPRKIVEIDAIKNLWKSTIVVSCGGGGIPVVENPDGTLEGVAAVIDKDFAAELLAEQVDADIMMILTEVEKVAVNWGKPDQRSLDKMSLKEAARYVEEGQFAPGSMLPKVEACMKFVRQNPQKKAIITSLAVSYTHLLAGATISVMVPLGTFAGVPPYVMIIIYNFALGIAKMFTPTSIAVMTCTQYAKIDYMSWVKAVWKPLVVIFLVCLAFALGLTLMG